MLLPGTTINGVILDFAVDVTTAGAVRNNLLVIGMGIRNETTLAEIDGPISEQHQSWMLYRPLWMFNDTTADRQFDVDDFRSVVRSRRRIRGLGDRLVLNAQAVDGAYTIDFHATIFLALP